MFSFSLLIVIISTINTLKDNLTMDIASVIPFFFGYGPDKHTTSRGHFFVFASLQFFRVSSKYAEEISVRNRSNGNSERERARQTELILNE